MAARSLASGTISFGLVAIPIRLYPATVPERVTFHLLHAKCGNRIKYQTYCPVCDQVVERKEVTIAPPRAPRGKVIDLMDALKKSLEKRSGADGARKGGPGRKGLARASRRAAETPRLLEKQGLVKRARAGKR